MTQTGFLRSDDLPGDAAIGYLDASGSRSNILHLPVLGSGDGGIYSTVGDIHRFWAALRAGGIVPPEWVETMVRPRSDVAEVSMRYGLGFWLHESSDVVLLVGGDAGVSFHSSHDPASGLTTTLLSNTVNGVWPLVG
jgi:CubicO group peptidase (beta-lactamase class C family)